MMFRRLLTVAILLLPPLARAAPPHTNPGVTIREPLGGSMYIRADGNALFTYITQSLGWLQEIAVGVVILWLLFAGIMIMISGNDQGKRTQAKDHAVAAIIGLLMLFLFGFLLSVLNQNFFVQ